MIPITMYFGRPAASLANIAIPSIAITIPAMLVLLLPVVVIEAWVLARRLNLYPRSAVGTSALANLTSTLVGFPLVWFVSFGLGMGVVSGMAEALPDRVGDILESSWYSTVILGGNPYPYAGLLSLVPYFLGSWLIELLVWRLELRQADGRRLTVAVFVANLLTYSLLAVLYVCMLVFTA